MCPYLHLCREDGMPFLAEAKRLQAKLAQRYKMEAIGTLTGGIAHDFDTILAATVDNQCEFGFAGTVCDHPQAACGEPAWPPPP